ncbi:unnamed protein product [Coffea canephora]|uniref:Uncharacterized protein n=1 Tax=Coffea canephora TaxID=49390 RepID=A0A068TTN9_COFCA|nr:unnamed protein product [Coffea canephora]
MASSSCILQKSILPGVFVLITFSAFSGCGVLSIFITSLVLIISAILFTYANREYQEETVQAVEVLSQSIISHPILQRQDSPESESEGVDNKPVKEASQHQQDSPEFDEVDNESGKEVVGISNTEQQQCFPHFNKVSEGQKAKADESNTFQEKAVQNQGGGAAHQIHPDLYSESESIDGQSFSSDQDSDIDWSYSGNLPSQSAECSDDSISDEESLIEIALPSGHYVGPKEEYPKFSWQQKFQDFSTETKMFHQHSIKQLFAEINDMNEEENLIEIDLSMGSIKCSRFEIEA